MGLVPRARADVRVPKRGPFISPSSPFHHSPRDRSSSSRCPLLVFCSRMRGEFMQHELVGGSNPSSCLFNCLHVWRVWSFDV
jgi:hypothetical protein